MKTRLLPRSPLAAWLPPPPGPLPPPVDPGKDRLASFSSHLWKMSVHWPVLRVVLALWSLLRERVPSVPAPLNLGVHSDDLLAEIEWADWEKTGDVIHLEVGLDGKIEWFFFRRTDDDVSMRGAFSIRDGLSGHAEAAFRGMYPFEKEAEPTAG